MHCLIHGKQNTRYFVNDEKSFPNHSLEPVLYLIKIEFLNSTKTWIWPNAYIYAFSSERVNPLPTNDAPMRHDLCELSISLWEFIWGV